MSQIMHSKLVASVAISQCPNICLQEREIIPPSPFAEMLMKSCPVYFPIRNHLRFQSRPLLFSFGRLWKKMFCVAKCKQSSVVGRVYYKQEPQNCTGSLLRTGINAVILGDGRAAFPCSSGTAQVVGSFFASKEVAMNCSFQRSPGEPFDAAGLHENILLLRCISLLEHFLLWFSALLKQLPICFLKPFSNIWVLLLQVSEFLHKHFFFLLNLICFLVQQLGCRILNR